MVDSSLRQVTYLLLLGGGGALGIGMAEPGGCLPNCCGEGSACLADDAPHAVKHLRRQR